MHLNFYFLQALSKRLNNELKGKTLIEAFSQTKNEVLFAFNSQAEVFWLRANLDPGFTCVSFPVNFQRAKRNSVDLFGELKDQIVSRVSILNEDRILTIDFESDHALVLVLFGNQSNALVLKSGEIIYQFNRRKKLLDLMAIDKAEKQEVTAQLYSEKPELTTHFPKLRGLPTVYFESMGLQKFHPKDQWDKIQTTLTHLENPNRYYLTRINGNLHLSLLEIGDTVEQSEDILEISNKFFHSFISESKFQHLQSQLLNQLKTSASKSSNTIRKAKKRLDQLNTEIDYQLYGDLLMANLQTVPPHSDSVELPHFESQEKVRIKLKPTISAQKNAENYYRKAKSLYLEIENLTSTIQVHNDNLNLELQLIEKVEKCSSLKELKALNLTTNTSTKRNPDQNSLPYITKDVEGFKILIGKNAKSNDKLLSKYAKKDDLWFHVKDATGSHVILKNTGSTPPIFVLEKVASIAAYYSKRKTEGLVPVAYTQRKFVRKRKGDPPGMVVVDKEKTLLVPPENLS